MPDFTSPDSNGISVPVATPDYEAGQVLKDNFENISTALTAEASARASADALLQTLANLTQSIPLNSTSETLYPSAKAVYDFAAISVAGLMEIKGNLDCSTNPNYPSALVGDTYYVTVAGKIGGASGITVEVGDAIVCKVDNAGGTEAAVGTSWFILEHNLQGALLAANNLSDLASAATARTNLGLANVDVDTPNFVSLMASEDLVAGNMVNIHLSGGVAKIRKATNTSAGTEADGFVIASVTTGNMGTVHSIGKLNTALSGLTIGSTYYLSTAGGVTATAPSSSGNIVQRLGKATSATALQLTNLFSVTI